MVKLDASPLSRILKAGNKNSASAFRRVPDGRLEETEYEDVPFSNKATERAPFIQNITRRES
jgi:hypothetical protein